MPLFDLYLADKSIPEGTFGITGGAVAAYGVYRLREDGKPAGVMLVEHPTAEAATSAVSRLAVVRRSWGEEQVAAEPFLIFKAGQDDYCVIGSSGKLFAAAFFMPSAAAGVDLVRKAFE